jgi:pyridoxal phosphate enzyme (YggS family)
MSLEEQYFELKSELDARQVQLVAVSKTYPAERVMELYQLGQRAFGENKVQELLSKKEHLPNDIRWHLIGHLQSNKVRQVVGSVDLIQSVDSVKLLKRIHREAEEASVQVNILLQIKIAAEETKYGFDPHSVIQELEAINTEQMSAIRFCGVMGMASFVDDPDQVRNEFKFLKQIFDTLKESVFKGRNEFDQISMGMSGDYVLALDQGSTIVRVGSLLFGPRT